MLNSLKKLEELFSAFNKDREPKPQPKPRPQAPKPKAEPPLPSLVDTIEEGTDTKELFKKLNKYAKALREKDLDTLEREVKEARDKYWNEQELTEYEEFLAEAFCFTGLSIRGTARWLKMKAREF
ncbi:hypothetical protein JCM9492_11480 [Aquifex pyrophilus]